MFRYAVATGLATDDLTAALRGALATPKTRHRASITDPKLIGPLLRAVNGYGGSFVTACALKLAPLLFVRPGELRHAEWSEFDLEGAEWRIPAAKMKMRAVHIVPLSVQAVAVLRELHPLTGRGRYVFPGVRSPRQPMSENTVLAALRRLGYSGEEMTGHGFRSMASTRLHEIGWSHDAIERQLAHAERNKVSAAYNYSEHLPERRQKDDASLGRLPGQPGARRLQGRAAEGRVMPAEQKKKGKPAGLTTDDPTAAVLDKLLAAPSPAEPQASPAGDADAERAEAKRARDAIDDEASRLIQARIGCSVRPRRRSDGAARRGAKASPRAHRKSCTVPWQQPQPGLNS